MAYIVACIEFDTTDYNKFNVKIMDNETGLTIRSEKLKELIPPNNKNPQFCIKISLNNCSWSSDPDCFTLSNNTSYKLDFDTLVTTTSFLTPAMLSSPLSSASSSGGLHALSTKVVTNSFDGFKAKIIKLLTTAMTGPSFDGFKAEIINQLTKAMTELKFHEFKQMILTQMGTP